MEKKALSEKYVASKVLKYIRKNIKKPTIEQVSEMAAFRRLIPRSKGSFEASGRIAAKRAFKKVRTVIPKGQKVTGAEVAKRIGSERGIFV